MNYKEDKQILKEAKKNEKKKCLDNIEEYINEIKILKIKKEYGWIEYFKSKIELEMENLKKYISKNDTELIDIRKHIATNTIYKKIINIPLTEEEKEIREKQKEERIKERIEDAKKEIIYWKELLKISKNDTEQIDIRLHIKLWNRTLLNKTKKLEELKSNYII